MTAGTKAVYAAILSRSLSWLTGVRGTALLVMAPAVGVACTQGEDASVPDCTSDAAAWDAKPNADADAAKDSGLQDGGNEVGPDAGLDAGSALALAVGGDGEIAAFVLGSPWPVLATASLEEPVVSARYHGGMLYVVHPSPADKISVIAVADLSLTASIQLESGADPRDIAFVDDATAIVSQAGLPSLARVDLGTLDTSEIDLSALADVSGNPDAMMLANCGKRVFVGLRRLEATAALGVVDVAQAGGGSIVDIDPATPGLQGVALQSPPAFDMQVDCAAARLYVAEPQPLMVGGGGVEQIDLNTFFATAFPLTGMDGEVGGFVLSSLDKGWMIAHTEYGPAPSSHLFRLGPGSSPSSIWDTFADKHVDNLAFDIETRQLLFPDPCTTDCPPQARTGVQVFDSESGQRLTKDAIDVGFPPYRVVIAVAAKP